MIEYRRYARLRVLHTTARYGDVEADVLNVSRSGMLLETRGSIRVGDELDFDISDRSNRLTVSGEVRWARPRGDSGAYRAGIRFVRVLSHDARGVWARLVAESNEPRKLVRRRPPIDVAGAGQMPLLTILVPRDGAVVHRGDVIVIGEVRDRGLGSMIEVNGVRALVYGRCFEARVPLNEGRNLLSAVIATSGAPVCRSPAVRVTRAVVDSQGLQRQS